jgi:hypothetical protein
MRWCTSLSASMTQIDAANTRRAPQQVNVTQRASLAPIHLHAEANGTTLDKPQARRYIS